MAQWRKTAIGFALVAPLAVVLWQGWRAARMELAAFDPPRGPVARPDSLDGLEGLRDVDVVVGSGSRAITVRGFWVPTQNGAAVVLAHGSYCNRMSMLAEARALGRAGFGVVFFDWPGHGESDGRVTLGETELASLRAVVDFVTAQPGVDGARIGALGTSVGAALLAKAASTDRRLRALVLVGAFTDSEVQTRYEFRRPWAYWPALWVDHRHMEAPLKPIEVMPALTGRALLVVAGEKDAVVPPSMAQALYARAPGPDKELWLVPGAGHSDLEETTAGEFTSRIARFFERTLAAKG